MATPGRPAKSLFACKAGILGAGGGTDIVSELVRFTGSLEADLVERFDRYRARGRFATRTEAVRKLLRQTLAEEAWAVNADDVMATLSLVYDHHLTSLTDKLLKLQHEFPERVAATMHVRCVRHVSRPFL